MKDPTSMNKKGLTRVGVILLVSLILASMVFGLMFVVANGTTIWTTDSEGTLTYDFAPGDIVYISGEGFAEDTALTVEITRPNDDVDYCDALSCPNPPFLDGPLTSEPDGTFSDYQYDLDGVEGEYSVEVSDGINPTATTTFTDYTKVECYSDSGYTNKVYTFASGATVYGKIPGSNLWSSKFQWVDQNNNIVRTSPCNTRGSGGPFYDTYTLTGAGVGTWKVERLVYADSWSCSGYSGKETTLFTVTSTCTDADGDHYFVQSSGCDAEPDFLGHNDCDDSDSKVNPGADEICDGKDNDCDGGTVDGSDENWLNDPCDGADTDLCEEGSYICSAGSQTCNDNTGDDVEICDNQIDDDCDGQTDEGCSVCGNGIVESGEQCDDGNTANGDCCSSTCQYEQSGSSCSDGDVCNGDETCDGAGTCSSGTPLTCDDSNVCTDDSCDSQLGCQHINNANSCDDGEFCTVDDVCSGGQCGGSARDCSDSVGCTDDSCNEGTDSCVHVVNDANCPTDTICADYYCSATLDCQVNYASSATVCRQPAGVCDLAETCTGSSATCPVVDSKSTAQCRPAVDVCDVAENCDGINNDCPADAFASFSTPCDNGLWCDGDDHCDGSGLCINLGPAVDCDDENECTLDSCDEGGDTCVNPLFDPTGPVTSNVAVVPIPSSNVINVTALETETCANIAAAEYYFDGCNSGGTGHAMTASDGTFDELVEEVEDNNVIPKDKYGLLLPDGRHTICIRGQNSDGYWGDCKCAAFELDKVAPNNPDVVALNGQSWVTELLVCGQNPTLTGHVCDSESILQTAEYFVNNVNDFSQFLNWEGISMTASDGAFDESCEDVNAVVNISNLEEGTHYIKFHAKDTAENWGKLSGFNSVSFIKDTTAPATVKQLTPADGISVSCSITEANGHIITNGCAYVKQGTIISLSATDPDPQQTGEYAGNVIIKYNIYWSENCQDNWQLITPGQGNVDESVQIILNQDSCHLIEYWAEDLCGNAEEHHFELDIVDTVAPVTTKEIIGIKFYNATEDKLYIDGATEIKLTCVDPDPHPVDDVKIYYRYRVDDGTWPTIFTEYTGEFSFPEESKHELEYYCIDALRNEEIHKFEVDYVDHTPPVTTKTYGQPLVEEPTSGYPKWITSATLITLTADDGTSTHASGVANTYYRITQVGDSFCASQSACLEAQGIGDFLTYSNPFTIGEESCHLIEYYSVDNVQKTETTKRQCVYVDNTEPNIHKMISTPKHECTPEEAAQYGNPDYGCYYITQQTTIGLSCVDDNQPHPVDDVTLYYRDYLLGTSTPSYTAVPSGYVDIQKTEDSEHILEFYCEDALRNSEGTATVPHREIDIVDTVAPVTTKEIIGPQYNDTVAGKFYVDGATEIKLTCEDPQPHPVDHAIIYYRYRVDDGAWTEWTEYAGQFKFPEESKHELEFYCIDALGNEETHQTEIDYVDKTAPTTTKTYGTPFYTDEIKEWINSSTPITLTVDDTGTHKSGIKETKYRVTQQGSNNPCNSPTACDTAAGSGSWNTYSTPFTIGQESCHLIEYYSVDNVDKTEVIKRQCVFVDNTPPKVYKDLGYPKHSCNASETLEGITDCSFITQNNNVNLWCVDQQGSGNHPVNAVKIWYKIDWKENAGDPWTEGSWTEDGSDVTFKYDKDSYHKLTWYCEDALGNSQPQQVELDIVDTQAPTSQKTLGDPKHECTQEEQELYYNGMPAQTDGCYFINSNTPITLTCSDEEPHPVDHAVVYYRYWLAGGQTPSYFDHSYGNSVTLNIYEDSAHIVEWYCEDALGNAESHHIEYDIVDNQKPVTVKEILGPRYDTTEPVSSVLDFEEFARPTGYGAVGFVNYGGLKFVAQYNWYAYYDYENPHLWDPYWPHSGIARALPSCYYSSSGGPYIEFPQDVTFDGAWFTGGGPIKLKGYNDGAFVSETGAISLSSTPKWVAPDFSGLVDKVMIVYGGSGSVYCNFAMDDLAYTKAEKTYIDGTTTIKLTCTDPEPHPVDHVNIYYRYRVDDGAWNSWTKYIEPFSFPEESRHELEYFCNDSLGNTEVHKFEIDHVDKTPPTTTKTYGTPAYPADINSGASYPYWITPDTEITLTVDDTGIHKSGIKETMYRVTQVADDKCASETACDTAVGSGSWTHYTIPFKITQESCHLIEYNSTDNVDKAEQIKRQCVFVDNKAPSIDKTIVGPSYGTCPPDSPSDTCFIDGSTIIRVESTDPEPHPVDHVTCDWDYTVTDGTKVGTGQIGLTPPFDINFPEESTHELTIVCKDALENTITDVEQFIVDKTAPTTTKTYGTPYYTDGSAEWITSQTSITLSVEDTGIHKSGIKETKYRVTLVDDSYCASQTACEGATGSGNFLTYSAPFTIAEDSCHLIEYYSVDNVDKTETTKRQCVYVDNKVPIITKEVGEPKIACGVGEGCDYWVQDHVTPIDLYCSDDYPHPVNHVNLWYRILLDGQILQDWTDAIAPEVHKQIIFEEDSVHTLQYYCEDALGNSQGTAEAPHEQVYRVDSTPPVTTKTVGSPTYPASEPDITDFGLKGDQITNFWIRDKVSVISLDATDYADPCDIGVKEIHYRIGKDTNENNVVEESEMDSWIIVSRAHVDFTIDEDCLHKIEWFAVDLLGNTEQTHVQYHRVDSTPPNSIKTITGSTYGENDYWVTSDTQFTLTAVDEAEPCAVGVEKFHVKIEWDSDCDGIVDMTIFNSDVNSPYTFYLNHQCLNKITWYAIDFLENEEEPKEQYHMVDNAPPHVLILKPVDGWYSDGEDIPIVSIAQDLNGRFTPCEYGHECDFLDEECAVGIEDNAQCYAYLLDVLPYPQIVELETEGTFMYNADAHECQGYATIPEESGIPDGVAILVVRAEDSLGNEAGSLAEILRAVLEGCGCDVYDTCMPDCVNDVMQDIVTIWNLPKIGIDNHAPEVTITEPEEGDLFGGEELDFTAEVTDSSDGEITSTITSGTPCYVSVAGISLGTVPYNNDKKICSGAIMIPDDVDFPQGTQSLTIEIADNAGNIGSGSVEIEVDTVKPVLDIIIPSENQFVSGTQQIKFSVTDQNIDTSLIKLSMDNEQTWTSDIYGCGTDLYCYDWDTTKETDGMAYGIIATATDEAGNTGYSEAVVVIVDNDAPEGVYVLDPTKNEIISGEITLKALATDYVSGIQSVKIYVNNGPWYCDANLIGGTWQCTLDTTTLPEGQHNAYAVAIDNLDQETTSASVPFIIDNENPSIPILYVNDPDGDGYDTDGTVTWHWSESSDAGSGIDYYIIEVSSPGWIYTKVYGTIFTVSDLWDGEWHATVWAVDKAGHQSDASNEVAIIVDTTAPSPLTIWATDVENPVYDTDGSYVLWWSGGSDANFDRYELYEDDSLIYSGSDDDFSIDDMLEGNHRYQVIAYDLAGYSTASSFFDVFVDTITPTITSGEENQSSWGPIGWWFEYSVNDGTASSGLLTPTYSSGLHICSWNPDTLTGNCLVIGTADSITVYATDKAGHSVSLAIERGVNTDFTAPVLLTTNPSGLVTYNDVTLTATTDENAECYYGTIDDIELMSQMDNNGGELEYGTSHLVYLGTLTDGLYVYHIRCEDVAGNMMEHSKTVVFSINTESQFCYSTKLKEGWNTFFLPQLILDDIKFNCGIKPYETADVLESLDGNYEVVWYYDGAHWLSYSPTVPSWMNNLLQFNDVISNPYFIKMNNADRLELVCEECPTQVCGNGVIEGTEICDSNSQSCTVILTQGYAGIQLCNEQCSGWGICTSTEYCGDGIVNGPEVCDDGQQNGEPNQCNSQCTGQTEAFCGNGILEAGEQCESPFDLCCYSEICQFKLTETECRASAGDCDIAEYCTGQSATCPSDAFQPADTACPDELYCNGNEVCDGNGICLSGTPVSCTVYDILGIARCDNDPDNIAATWDYRVAFTSTCNELTGCTTGDETITHTCDKTQCEAECDAQNPCLGEGYQCDSECLCTLIPQ